MNTEIKKALQGQMEMNNNAIEQTKLDKRYEEIQKLIDPEKNSKLKNNLKLLKAIQELVVKSIEKNNESHLIETEQFDLDNEK